MEKKRIGKEEEEEELGIVQERIRRSRKSRVKIEKKG
jgi:hypothetical protein